MSDRFAISDPFAINGADGTTIEVLPGEFYFNTKARTRWMMLHSLSNEARQIYACLELGTMGFRQELAVTMERGEKRPLAPSDIARQTSLSNQNVRRGLVELEGNGLAERRSDDGGRIRKHHILIFSWAFPRPRNAQESSRARLPLPQWFPESWSPLKPLIKRLRLIVAIDEEVAPEYLSEGERIARDYQKAEQGVMRFLERVCARPKKRAPSKEERTERNIERKASLPSSVSAEETSRAKPKTTNSPQPVDPRATPANSASNLIQVALGFYGPVPGVIANSLVVLAPE